MKIRLDYFHLSGGGGFGTSIILKMRVGAGGLEDITEAILISGIGEINHRNMITDGVELFYIASDGVRDTVFKRKCADLTYVDGTYQMPTTFNGSDFFTDIMGITLLGDNLYVLDSHSTGGSVPRVVVFDKESFDYVTEYDLNDVSDGIWVKGIDNDGSAVYVVTAEGVIR